MWRRGFFATRTDVARYADTASNAHAAAHAATRPDQYPDHTIFPDAYLTRPDRATDRRGQRSERQSDNRSVGGLVVK